MMCPNCKVTLNEHPNDILHCPTCVFNVPKNKKVLDEMYAWVSVDPDGREGFIAANIGGVFMALTHSERHKIEELREIAKQLIGQIPGYRARLIHFRNREVVDQLAGDAN